MSMQNLNVDGKLGGVKGKVRKRGCSSSSSSSMAQNYRLKRAIFVGTRGGSTTPVPMWKMMSSESQSLENDKAFSYLVGKCGGNAKGSSVSARKLAAILWETNGMPSPRVKLETLEDKISEVGMVRKERILDSSKLSSMELGSSDPYHRTVSERMDPSKLCSCRRRALAGFQKLLQVDQRQNRTPTPCGHIPGLSNHLKNLYNGLTTSRELLKLLSRVWGLEQVDCASLFLVSALKVKLDRACSHTEKLIQGRKTNRSEIDILLKQFGPDKVVSKIKEQDSIHSALTSIALQREKKLRQKTEKLSKKLEAELAETKASLTRAVKELNSEKKARREVEQVCNELAQGIGELKRQFAKIREEVEKEREMFRLADVIREERVQMKLAEAKYLFEEKNALVDKLRNELEAYLKSMTGDEQGCGSPRYEKTKKLEKFLRETFQGSHQNQDKEKEGNEAAYNNDEEEEDESDDSDLHSIELNVDDISKSSNVVMLSKTDQKGTQLIEVNGEIAFQRKPKNRPFAQNQKLQLEMVLECDMCKQENQVLFHI